MQTIRNEWVVKITTTPMTRHDRILAWWYREGPAIRASIGLAVALTLLIYLHR